MSDEIAVAREAIPFGELADKCADAVVSVLMSNCYVLSVGRSHEFRDALQSLLEQTNPNDLTISSGSPNQTRETFYPYQAAAEAYQWAYQGLKTYGVNNSLKLPDYEPGLRQYIETRGAGFTLKQPAMVHYVLPNRDSLSMSIDVLDGRYYITDEHFVVNTDGELVVKRYTHYDAREVMETVGGLMGLISKCRKSIATIVNRVNQP